MNVEGHPRMGLAARHDRGGDGEVTQPWVGRRADHHLRNLPARDRTHRYHVAGGARQRDQRLHSGEIDLVGDVVAGAGVGEQLTAIIGAPYFVWLLYRSRVRGTR